MPTRRCSRDLIHRLQQTRRQLPGAQIVVVEPETAEPRSRPAKRRVSRLADHILLVTAPLGRGTQCNGGARAATGDLLLFLHDDTSLPETAASVIERAFRDPDTQIACFRLAFDHSHWLLRLYAGFSAFDSLVTSFGDQGILIRRALFERIGGFPDWPLFEDVELLRNARRNTRVVKLPARVTTSAVRFVEGGMIRQQLLNTELIVRFVLGADPQALWHRYERRRPDC